MVEAPPIEVERKRAGHGRLLFGLLLVHFFVALFFILSNSPSHRSVTHWDQPGAVSYDSHGPYAVYVLEGPAKWYPLFVAKKRRYYTVLVTHSEPFSEDGHRIDCDFQHGQNEPDDYIRSCTTEWTPDGVTLTQPTGHRLFIPKSAFIGGR